MTKDVLKKGVRFDLHCGGPKVYTDHSTDRLMKEISQTKNIPMSIFHFNQNLETETFGKDFNEYKKILRKSGLNFYIKTIGVFGEEPLSMNQLNTEIDDFNNLVSRRVFNLIKERKDIASSLQENVPGVLLRIENVLPIERNLTKGINLLHKRGVRIIQPTYNYKNSLAFGCLEKRDLGIKIKGKFLIRLVNQKNIILDLSHTGEKSSLDTLKFSAKPVICSHSFSKKVYNSSRGKTDRFIKKLNAHEGFFGVTLNPYLISKKNPSFKDFFLHLEHISKIMDSELIGIGTDWDTELTPQVAKKFNECGLGKGWEKKFEGYRGMQDWNNIIKNMNSYGFEKEFIRGVSGNNFFKFIKKQMY